MTSPMMKCGHAANAKDSNTGAPVCVICLGIMAGARDVDDSPPDLTGRMATCRECTGGGGKYKHKGDGCPQPSSPRLAFFSVHMDKPVDEYYCGCWGFD